MYRFNYEGFLIKIIYVRLKLKHGKDDLSATVILALLFLTDKHLNNLQITTHPVRRT